MWEVAALPSPCTQLHFVSVTIEQAVKSTTCLCCMNTCNMESLPQNQIILFIDYLKKMLFGIVNRYWWWKYILCFWLALFRGVCGECLPQLTAEHDASALFN